MLPQTMKAAVVHEFGKPLSIEERLFLVPPLDRFRCGRSRVECAIPISTQLTVIGL